MNKRGNILTENIIFIILNFIFLSILIVFIFSQTGSAARLEEQYAKQIALMIDASEPGMILTLDVERAIREAGDNYKKEFIFIEDNLVRVQLREKGGYTYSYFKDYNVNPYPKVGGKYVFTIKKNE